MIGKVNAGGSSLLLHVIVGGAQPSSPAENTIWINTATPTTDWAVGYNLPSSGNNGQVFIQCIGYLASNNLELLHIHSLKICPTYFYQYSSGAWSRVAGAYYVNGNWVSVGAT